MTQKNREEIVPLRRYHLEQMAEIEALCFSVPWTRDMLAEELKTPLSRYFVYERNGDALGYIGTRMVLDECHITNVATHPAYRRQGIAKALLTELERYARQNDMSFLILEVRESNDPARRFYENQGFRVLGRRKGYYEKPVEDAILMTKIFAATEETGC